jgi:hypothetical protein
MSILCASRVSMCVFLKLIFIGVNVVLFYESV